MYCMCIDSVGCSQISMYVVVKLNLLPKPEAPKDQICRGLRIKIYGMENYLKNILKNKAAMYCIVHVHSYVCTAYRKMLHVSTAQLII